MVVCFYFYRSHPYLGVWSLRLIIFSLLCGDEVSSFLFSIFEEIGLPSALLNHSSDVLTTLFCRSSSYCIFLSSVGKFRCCDRRFASSWLSVELWGLVMSSLLWNDSSWRAEPPLQEHLLHVVDLPYWRCRDLHHRGGHRLSHCLNRGHRRPVF